MGGGLENPCVVRVYSLDPHRTHTGPPPIYKLGAENHMMQL